jgi:hypothetical protein
MHAREKPTRRTFMRYIHEMQAYEMHTYEMQAYEMHTYEMQDHEMHASKRRVYRGIRLR